MRIGFCVLDKNYEKYLKNININSDYYIYSNTKLIKNSKTIPLFLKLDVGILRIM